LFSTTAVPVNRDNSRIQATTTFCKPCSHFLPVLINL
jgi:hypothetical protein